ncbi:alpha/beta fold hydrolase [[Kitasatospora] papulosa]|uniref:thioesterase II family protein n=1 Tax=[Kitasatospora] papulosa TaxID=1464011 RepID=UPI002E145487|nr:alpha/beta fold hydrolase [[Kitasatospora] papulosa]
MTTSSPADSTKWFRRTGFSIDPKIRLVCFPHAGGTASFFQSWSKHLPHETEVLAVRYPGREDRLSETPIERMEELSEAIATSLGPLLDRPMMFFGHSMGASIAHEVALRLEAQHSFKVQSLFLSGRAAPERLATTDVTDLSDLELLEEVSALGGTQAMVFEDPELRDLLLSTIRADYRLLEKYKRVHRVKVMSPIFAYLGESDKDVTFGDMRAWARWTRGSFGLRSFPGGHFYLIEQKISLLTDISTYIDRVARGTITPGLPQNGA